MRIEKEIKLQQQSLFSNSFNNKKIVPLNDICDILNQFHIQINKLDKIIHNDTYFDTGTFFLYSADASLRIRRDENRLILKQKAASFSSALCRREWQYYLTERENALDVATEMFHKHIKMENIYPILDIHIIRNSIYVTTDIGKYQICLDEYVCQTVNNAMSQSCFEMEIETILSYASNDVTLEHFINYVKEKFNLSYVHQSKYHIGISKCMKKENFS